MKAMRQRSSDSSGSELVIQCDRDIQFAAVKKSCIPVPKPGLPIFWYWWSGGVARGFCPEKDA